MLREGKGIELEQGQGITVVAVGDEYDQWEGYKDPATGGWMTYMWAAWMAAQDASLLYTRMHPQDKLMDCGQIQEVPPGICALQERPR
jgi:hypothetical protein